MNFLLLVDEKIAFELAESVNNLYDIVEAKTAIEEIIEEAYDSEVLDCTVNNLTISEITPILSVFLKATRLDYNFIDKLLCSWFIDNGYALKIISEDELEKLEATEEYRVFYRNVE